MTTFEDILCKAKNVAESAGKKTNDLVEMTKLKMEAAETEKDIASTLEGLGRLVYDGKKAGEDVSVMTDECVRRVDELTEKLEGIREKILEYKNAIRCSKCGAVNTDDSDFCKKCGARLREE